MDNKIQNELLNKIRHMTMDLIQVHIELLNAIDEKPNFMNILGGITDQTHSVLTAVMDPKKNQ